MLWWILIDFIREREAKKMKKRMGRSSGVLTRLDSLSSLILTPQMAKVTKTVK